MSVGFLQAAWGFFQCKTTTQTWKSVVLDCELVLIKSSLVRFLFNIANFFADFIFCHHSTVP